ncbi:MAG: InlB B-repeat-containing protein, partial [Clostridia bacterium]|nr:InlB B-repeat-containing protein [Clostridia bacterium]
NGTYAGMSIKNIIKATDPYIDYSKLDKNGDGILSQHELLIVIMNAGYSQESSGISDRNPNQPRNYYAVWSTSQGVSISMDGVTFQSTNGAGNVTNMGEYLSPGKRQLVGTACHELCHNLGAEDIYARKVGATGNALTPWPFVNNFSLQCNGNYSSGGASPTYLDPYQRIYLGWADEVVVGEGEYTLYSTCTGKYQVLRVNTPDPDEYYLIELRLKESFEVGLTSGSAKGGIVVWHIDESSNRKYFTSGTACSNYMFDGAYHDPGIVVCHPYSSTLKGIPNQTPSSDAFFHADATSKYNKEFNSMDYKSPLGGTTGTVCGLNSYPAGWIGEEYWNLKVVPLDPAGQEMRIQISIESKGMVAPTATVNSTTASGTTVSVKGSIEESTLTYTSMGFEIATNVGFSDNYQKVEVNSFDDTGVFTGLLENKTYRVRSFAVTDSGTIYSQPKLVKTGADPKVNVNFVDGEATNTVVVKVGETVAEPEAPTKVGFTFGGWYTDNTFKTKYDFSTVLTESGDISLYANWIEDKPEETTQATQATEATTEASKPSSGCKSIVGSTGIVTLAVTLVGYAVVRKKKED